MGSARLTVVPRLRSRPLDLLIVGYFIYYWFSVMMTDLHNFSASLLGLSVEELVRRGLPWPPAALSRLYLAWARAADPLLFHNPRFFQVMEWINLVLLMPFSLAAAYAFARGRPWVRRLGLVTQAFTLYSVLLCVGCTLELLRGGPSLPAFLVVYAPFLVMPLVVMARLWGDQPFQAAELARRRGALRALCWLGGAVLSGSLLFQVHFALRHW